MEQAGALRRALRGGCSTFGDRGLTKHEIGS